jgi:hypothetical protein
MFAYVRICSLNSPIKNYGHCCWEKFWTGSRSDERAYPQGSGSKERQKRFFARQTNPILPNCMRHNNMQPPQLPCARLGIWRHLELLRVVTGCDGKCYGLNICKRLRINMCDGVTAWGGDIQRGKAEVRRQNVECRNSEPDRNRQPARAPDGSTRGLVRSPFPAFYRLLSLIIGYYRLARKKYFRRPNYYNELRQPRERDQAVEIRVALAPAFAQTPPMSAKVCSAAVNGIEAYPIPMMRPASSMSGCSKALA